MSLKAPLKVALVGCGKIADGHVEEIQKMPERRAGGRGLRSRAPHGRADGHALRHPGVLRLVRGDARDRAAGRRSHHDAAAVAPRADARRHRRRLPRLRREAAHAELRRLQGAGRARREGGQEADHRLHVSSSIRRRSRCGVSSAEGVLGDVVHVESWFGYGLAGQFGAAIMGDPSHWVHALPGKLFHNNIDHLSTS